MSGIPRSTIEQWVVLRAVVKEGSYAAAALALNRSQSAVSYAIARLQDAMGGQLLELQGRRAVLSETGALFLAEVEPLIEDLARIERRARSTLAGRRTTLRLLIDTLFARKRLFPALEKFTQGYPDVEVRLSETVKLGLQDLAERDYDIAILCTGSGARDADIIAQACLIAVASADHPLANAGQPLSKAALSRYPCAEIYGMESLDGEQRPHGRSWSMNTIDSAIDAVRHGLCYGWLPQERIEHLLAANLLKPISLKRGGLRSVALAMRVSANSEGQTDETVAALANLLAATAQ